MVDIEKTKFVLVRGGSILQIVCRGHPKGGVNDSFGGGNHGGHNHFCNSVV